LEASEIGTPEALIISKDCPLTHKQPKGILLCKRKIVMKTQNAKELNVLLFPQTGGDKQLWVAQCIDLDFAAQGATIEQAKVNFAGTVDTHFALCLKYGETPFENVPPAPAWFQRDFGMIKSEADTEVVGDRTAKRRMIFKHAFAGV
jgi:hypothetical protein